MSKKFLFTVGLLFLSACYSILVLAGQDEAQRLCAEDQIVENISVIFWLAGSLLLFGAYYFSRSEERFYLFKWERNIFFLLLAIFFLFCGGEECSWGQRIFGFKTSGFMQIHNAQKEFNLHNLWIFQGYDQQMNTKTGIDAWLGRIFSLIWLFYCFFVPVLYHFSYYSNKIISHFYFPVIPLWLGVLFIFNYLISVFFEHGGFFLHTRPIIELKETLFALLYLLIAILFNLSTRKKIAIVDPPDFLMDFYPKLKGIPLLFGRSAKIIIRRFLSTLFN